MYPSESDFLSAVFPPNFCNFLSILSCSTKYEQTIISQLSNEDSARLVSFIQILDWFLFLQKNDLQAEKGPQSGHKCFKIRGVARKSALETYASATVI